MRMQDGGGWTIPAVTLLLCLTVGPISGCGSDPTPPVPPGIPAYIGLDGSYIQVIRRNDKSTPLRVRVVDATYRGVPGVQIRWSLSSLEGTFTSVGDTAISDNVTLTDQVGVSWVSVHVGMTIGEGQVHATVEGLTLPPVTFPLRVFHEHDVFVTFGPNFDCPEPFTFWNYGGSNEVVVLLGGTVHFTYADARWLHPGCRAVLVSISQPPGGNRFISDSLAPGGTFSFMPNVVGTWELGDPINGGGGKLTARR